MTLLGISWRCWKCMSGWLVNEYTNLTTSMSSCCIPLDRIEFPVAIHQALSSLKQLLLLSMLHLTWSLKVCSNDENLCVLIAFQDLHVVRDLLVHRLGSDFEHSAVENDGNLVSHRVTCSIFKFGMLTYHVRRLSKPFHDHLLLQQILMIISRK